MLLVYLFTCLPVSLSTYALNRYILISYNYIH